jgi:hypothetical protein
MKRTFLCFLIVAFGLYPVFSQNPSFRWLRDAGHLNNFIQKAFPGQQGDVFALLSRPEGMVVEHLDSTGTLLWSKQIPNIWNLCVTHQNDILLSGVVVDQISIGNSIVSGSPGKMGLLLRLDANGNLKNALVHKDYYTTFHEMETTQAGDIYLKGVVHDTLDFNGYLIINNTGAEFTHFILKLNSSFQPQSHFMLNVSPSQGFGDLVVQGSNVYLSGTYKDTVAIGNNIIYNHAGSGSFILGFDSQGQVTWNKILPDTWVERFHLDQGGNFYVQGRYEDTLVVGSKTITSKACNYNDCWNHFALKMDASGNPIYLTAIGQDYNSNVYSSAVTHDGHLYFTGDLVNTLLIGQDSIYVNGPWQSSTYLASLNAQGKLEWSMVPKQEFAAGTFLSTHQNGDIVWAGFARKLVMFPDSVECAEYNNQHFVSRFKRPGAATGLTEQNNSRFRLWPNPASGQFIMEGLDGSTKPKCSIYDSKGVCVRSFPALQKTEVVSTKEMAPGFYLIVIEDKEQRMYQKLLVE